MQNAELLPENKDSIHENTDYIDQRNKGEEDSKMGKQFRLIKKIDSGSFGDIYLGKSLETNQEVAVKVESITQKNPMLFYEAKIYQYIWKEKELSLAEKLWKERQPKIEKGFPEVFYCSNEGDYNVLIMEHLGPNLEDLFQICGRKFDAKTVCLIALQVLDRLQTLHSKYLVHRDIKPSNFCIGKGKKKEIIYMIDMAFAKKYLDKDGNHIALQEGKSLTGTLLFATVNNHKGCEHSRRDDLESLAYMMIYFLKGSLPWQHIKYSNRIERRDRTIEKKYQNPDLQLFKGIEHQEFKDFVTYAQNLGFDETPDYDMLREKLINLMTTNGWEQDNVYSWNIVAQSGVSQIKQIQSQRNSIQQ